MSGISVSLEAFDGPLDLLLHLIEQNKVDIFDIPIVEITNQYMEMVSQFSTPDMDTMSEFLVMAATLLKIKAKMLLPVQESEDGGQEDPRDELVRRLLEYKTYKYAALELKDLQVDAGRVVFKKATIPDGISCIEDKADVGELLAEVTLIKLQNIFNSVMKKQVDKIDPIRSKFGKIRKEIVSVKERMRYIEEYAMSHDTFSFREMLEEQPDKNMVIVSFLSILELMKMGKLQIVQQEIFDDIWIRRGELHEFVGA